jgi:tRNA pseudouridine38-40 synthase
MSQPHPDVIYRLTLAYDGTPFQGWQRQGTLPTVQYVLEQAVAACWGRPITVHGSGRTDTGVHALAQVAHFSAPRKFSGETLQRALNNNLPPEVRVTAARIARPGFHARFQASGKEYLYRVINDPVFPPFEINRAHHVYRPLNLQAIRRAARHLEGTHDFASYTSNPGYARITTVRTIHSIRVTKRGHLLTFRFSGSGFLYRMVRNLMGALIKVGLGRLQPDDLKKILEARSRQTAPNTAPACGLYLAKVHYGPTPADPTLLIAEE